MIKKYNKNNKKDIYKNKYTKPNLNIKRLNIYFTKKYFYNEEEILLSQSTTVFIPIVICLPFYARIKTTEGDVPIIHLNKKSKVITLNKNGKIEISQILFFNKVRVSNTHRLVRIRLDNGNNFEASFFHPDIEDNPIGFLEVGENYFGSRIIEKQSIKYIGKYTYDILLEKSDNYYFVNNIPLKSTLTISYIKKINFYNNILPFILKNKQFTFKKLKSEEKSF